MPLWASRSFNPHTHEGCDAFTVAVPLALIVSIHTPTKGVTNLGWQVNVREYGFNPHTHEGCDKIDGEESMYILQFQSTHPRRV